MVKREAYNAVINGEITEEVKEYFINELEKIDKQNLSRKSKMTEQQKENERIKNQIIDYFTENGKECFIDEVVEVTGITRQRCSILCNQLVKEGKLSERDEKVKGKGRRKLYFLTN